MDFGGERTEEPAGVLHHQLGHGDGDRALHHHRHRPGGDGGAGELVPVGGRPPYRNEHGARGDRPGVGVQIGHRGVAGAVHLLGVRGHLGEACQAYRVNSHRGALRAGAAPPR